MLLRLVEIGRTDDLAARVVLQRVLPGLLAVARRRRRPRIDGSFEELHRRGVGGDPRAPHRRRPEHVAANLVRDAAYRAFTAPGGGCRRPRSRSTRGRSTRTPAIDGSSACEELAALLAEARTAGVPSDDLDLVRDLLRTSAPPGRAPPQRQVTPRTVRNHRDRATARLRRLALAVASIRRAASDRRHPRPGSAEIERPGHPQSLERREARRSADAALLQEGGDALWASAVVAAAAITSVAYS